MTGPHSYASFLAEFDAYLHARAQLKATEDGSDDERLCISNCADQWRRVIDARAGLDATSSEPQRENK